MEHLLVFALLALGLNAAPDEEQSLTEINTRRNEINTPKIWPELWRSGYTKMRENQGCNSGGGKGGGGGGKAGGGGGKGGGKIGGKKKGKLTSLSDQIVEQVLNTEAKSDEEACMNLMKGPKNIGCCETTHVMKHKDDGNWKSGEGEWTCEDSVRLLKNRDLMDGDDNIDDSKVKEMMEEWVKKDPNAAQMKERIQVKCLGGEYKMKNPPEDLCDATQFHLCTGMNFMAVCENWKPDDHCKEMPDDSKQCRNMLDKETK